MAENTLTVASVDDEIKAAQAEVTDLEQRVIDGDTKVTASTIGKAREKLDFLGLRRKAAARAEKEHSESEHQKKVDALQDEVESFDAPGMESLRGRFEDAVNAISALRASLAQREQERSSLVNRASRLGIEGGRTRGVLFGHRVQEIPVEEFLTRAFDEGRGQRGRDHHPLRPQATISHKNIGA